MKISVLILFLCLYAIASFSQLSTGKPVAGPQYHINVPVGFIPVPGSSSFRHDSLNAIITLNEMHTPVEEVIEGLTAESFKSQGMTLIKEERVGYNGTKAMLYTVSEKSNGTTYCKHIFVFGDRKKTMLASGIYPRKHADMEKNIKISLLTISYHKDTPPTSEEAAKFSLDAKKHGFRLANFIGETLIYTTDGAFPSKGPVLIVASSTSRAHTADKKQYALNRLKKLPGLETAVVKKIKPVNINELNGYEIIAESKGNENNELVYMVILFTTANDYFTITGTARNDYEKNTERFRSVAQTFKHK